MLSNRQLFLNHVAQTSAAPLAFEIVRASGTELFGTDGQKWIDLISGISVSNVGHCHPEVVKAVQDQAESYMHVMVYGELIQSPQVKLAQALTQMLPHKLNNCYFVNSGSEAIEGAMKLAKRYTGRQEIIAFNHAYHGSTQGALSIIGSEYFRAGFHPLLPGISHFDYGDFEQLERITNRTACVIAEVVRGEAGAVYVSTEYLTALDKKCKQTGALLVLDEVQTGFRRTGPFMAFQHTSIVPDILVLAKSMGGGMPIGAFISTKEIMDSLSDNPVLGHITTFGGHPVSCAAALASLNLVKEMNEADISRKGELFRNLLVHDAIKEVTGLGLLLGIGFESEEINKQVINTCIKNGVFTDWFLFAPEKMRIAPPLIISDEQIGKACEIILKSIDEVVKN